MVSNRVRMIQRKAGGCPQRFWDAYNATLVRVARGGHPQSWPGWVALLAGERATRARGALTAAVHAHVLSREDAERACRRFWHVAGQRWSVEHLFDGARHDRVLVELARVVPGELAAGAFDRAV